MSPGSSQRDCHGVLPAGTDGADLKTREDRGRHRIAGVLTGDNYHKQSWVMQPHPHAISCYLMLSHASSECSECSESHLLIFDNVCS